MIGSVCYLFRQQAVEVAWQGHACRQAGMARQQHRQCNACRQAGMAGKKCRKMDGTQSNQVQKVMYVCSHFPPFHASGGKVSSKFSQGMQKIPTPVPCPMQIIRNRYPAGGKMPF